MGVRGGGDPEPGRVFLLHNNKLKLTKEIERPNEVAVANDGTFSVVDWEFGWGGRDNNLSGTLHVFDEDDLLFDHGFEANLGPTSITQEGKYVAVSTFHPDCTTYIFDVKSRELTAQHENREGNKQDLEFKLHDDEPLLMLSDSSDEDPYYGIDLSGDIAWRSEKLERKMRIEELIDNEDADSIETVIDELEEAYELSDDENEEKSIANKLADSHWKLAKEIKKEEGITNECWRHLNEAYAYYREILPWYDGKQGVAKIKRLQGKCYLKREEEESALSCFEEIQNLEEEYDVQLLTEADKRRLEELG